MLLLSTTISVPVPIPVPGFGGGGGGHGLVLEQHDALTSGVQRQLPRGGRVDASILD